MSTPDPIAGRSATPALPSNKQEGGLLGGLEIVDRHWQAIVLVICATVVVFVLAHESKAKSYTATANVTFQNNTLSDSALNISTATSNEPQREADTEVLVAHSAEVAQGVRGQLKLATSTSELLSDVKVEAAPTADVLNVVATTGNARTSATLANAFASQYIAFRAKAQLVGIASAQAKIRDQMSGLPSTSPERATLEQTLVRLGSLQAVAGSGANIIGRATPPASPNGGGVSEAVVIGFLVGGALAFSLVFLLESLDRRVKTVSDLERGYRLPALVGVPQTRVRAVHAESSVLLEPYRILRSALGFTAVTRPLNTLLVTSAVSGEGKTTVAVNLAHVMALSGRRTVLVELDLRRPATFGPIELGAARGVTTAITGAAELDSLLVRPLPDLPNLLVLPSGSLPHNPSELLGTQRVVDILSELAADGTMVIVDAPPLNPVADTQVLLDNPAINAAILVARIDRTTREEMRQARSILDHHKVEPVGIVVTGVRDPGRYGYGYGSYEAAGPIEAAAGLIEEVARPIEAPGAEPHSVRPPRRATRDKTARRRKPDVAAQDTRSGKAEGGEQGMRRPKHDVEEQDTDVEALAGPIRGSTSQQASD
jgi:capsular exopolysaccharide synthesis family protein